MQIHFENYTNNFAFWTNTFCNLNKYILQFEHLHFEIWMKPAFTLGVDRGESLLLLAEKPARTFLGTILSSPLPGECSLFLITPDRFCADICMIKQLDVGTLCQSAQRTQRTESRDPKPLTKHIFMGTCFRRPQLPQTFSQLYLAFVPAAF